jgi:hypothetical protein
MAVELPLQARRSDARIQRYTSLRLLAEAILINAWQGWHIRQAQRERDDVILAVYTR